MQTTGGCSTLEIVTLMGTKLVDGQKDGYSLTDWVSYLKTSSDLCMECKDGRGS